MEVTIPWSKVAFQEIRFVQVVEKSPAFNEAKVSVIVFIEARHGTLS